MFFLALLLAAKIETTPPVILRLFKSEDSCLLAAMKANAQPELNTEEARAAGAEAVCLEVISTNY